MKGYNKWIILEEGEVNFYEADFNDLKQNILKKEGGTMKKILSIFLAAVMATSVLPMTVMAEDAIQTNMEMAETLGGDYSDNPVVEVENLQSKFNFDGTHGGNLGGIESTNGVAGYTGNDAISYVANQDISSVYWEVGPIYGRDKNGQNHTFNKGERYIFSVMVKGASNAGLESPQFGSYMLYNTAADMSARQYLPAYPKGTYMQLTNEWQKYAGIYVVPDNFKSYEGIFAGFNVNTQTVKKGQGFVYDDVYFGLEAPCKIMVSGTKNVIDKGENVAFTAQILNQIDEVGELAQSVEWYVVDENRTEKIVNGFQFSSQNANTTLNVALDVDSGKYVVIAESKENPALRLGYEITIQGSYKGDNGSITIQNNKEEVSYDIFDEFTLTANNVSENDVDWYVLEENRRDEAKAINVASNGKTATVTFDETVTDGIYYIVAEKKSDKTVRTGYKIVVDNSDLRGKIISDFNSGSKDLWFINFDRYVSILGENTNLYKKTDKENLSDLIVEFGKTTGFTAENLSQTFKSLVILSLYNKNDQEEPLNDEDGAFIYEAELGLGGIDKGDVSIYKIYNRLNIDLKKAIVADVTGKDIESLEKFVKIFTESVFFKSIAYPSVYGLDYLDEILTEGNLEYLEIDSGKYFSVENNSGYKAVIARVLLTKKQLENILKDTILTEDEAEEYKEKNEIESEMIFPSNYPSSLEEKKLFSDVPESHWAYADIWFLTQMGVISGTSPNTFNPEGIVTREAAAKLICETFDLKSSGIEAEFTDVDKNAWYSQYINIAVENGVVMGISEDVFGVGRPVTRQDLCVMITRAMKVELQKIDSIYFEDIDQISEYAYDSIAYLNMYAIIDGYNDGTFRPYGNCKRAECAKILSKVVNLTPGRTDAGEVAHSKFEGLLFGIDAVDSDKYQRNDELTRGDLAEIILAICIGKIEESEWENNMNGVVESEDMSNIFNDVDVSHKNYAAIKEVTERGYMEGISENIFSPNTKVTIKEIVSIVISLLGYEKHDYMSKVEFGGTGYAEELGLLKGVDGELEDIAGYRDAIKIFANALDVGVARVGTIVEGNATITATSGKTFMTEIMEINYVEGIVTDNGITSLNGGTKVGDSSIKVGGLTLRLPEDLKKYRDLIGREVICYFDCSEGSKNDVVYMEVKDDDALEMALSDVLGFNGEILSYDVDGRVKTAKLAANPSLIYNGVYLGEYDDSIFDNENGDVAILSVYNKNDVIVLNSYRDFYVSKIDRESKKIYNSITYKTPDAEMKVLDLYEGRTYSDISIYDNEGNAIGLEDIEISDVLAVKINEEGNIVTVIKFNSQLSGVMVKSINEDEISDGENTYKLAKSFNNVKINIKAGKTYNLILNRFGRVVFIEETTVVEGEQTVILVRTVENEDEGAYIAKYYTTNKVIATGNFADRVILNGENVKKENIKPLLDGYVGEPIIIVVEDELIKSVKTAASISSDINDRGFYKITMNFDEKGNPIIVNENDFNVDDFAYDSFVTNWTSYMYKYWFRTISEGGGIKTFSGKFAMNASTNVFTVPVDENDLNDSKRYTYNEKEFGSHEFVMVDAYTYDKNSGVADLIVERTSTVSRNGSLTAEKRFLISKISLGINEDGEQKIILSGYNITKEGIQCADMMLSDDVYFLDQRGSELVLDGESDIYYTSNMQMFESVKNTVGNVGPRCQEELTAGDVIAYLDNEDGEIYAIGMNLDYEIDDTSSDNHGLRQNFEPKNTSVAATYGYAMSIEKGSIKILNKYIKNVSNQNVTLTLGGVPSKLDLTKYQDRERLFGLSTGSLSEVLFVQETYAGKIDAWLGSFDDVITYEDAGDSCDEVLLLSSYRGIPYGVIVYRDAK